jgi:capsule polysaccharide export protein KpsE/RkpR
METWFNITPYILALVRRKKTLVIHVLLISILAAAYVFLVLKREFKSRLIFLPPVSESNISSIMPGFSLPVGLMGEVSSEQIESIFSSNVLKRKIIDKFNLYDHYKMKKNKDRFENTRKLLDKSLLIDADERGTFGISKIISFTLSAYHTSPDTALQMTQYSFFLLDSTVKAISCGRAHRDRVFIEGQLEKDRWILDSLQNVLKDFQLKNRAYDVPEQIKLSIKAYADLKATILANEIRIKAINNEFAGETPELVSLRQNNIAFREKLSQMESGKTGDAVPSLKMSTRLFPEYTNLWRDVEVQNQLILYVTKELEQAKIKEAKDISGLVVVDPAFVPEYKARPKRLIVLGLIVAVYMLFICCCIVAQEMYRISLRDNPSIRAITAALLKK